MHPRKEEKIVKQVRERLAGEPACPFCGSDDLTYHKYERDFTTIYQLVDCEKCGEDWTDAYILQRVLYQDLVIYEDSVEC